MTSSHRVCPDFRRGFQWGSLILFCLAMPFAFAAPPAPAPADAKPNPKADEKAGRVLWLAEMALSGILQSWSKPGAKVSVNGTPLRIGGQRFKRGIGTHAASRFAIDLKGAALRFRAKVGVDDEVATAPASVIFRVYADRKKVFESGVLRGGNAPVDVDVDLAGVARLDLIVNDASDSIDYDHADWADAALILKKDAGATALPARIPIKAPAREILTPPAPDTPRINAPGVIGAGPEREFIYTIPVSGKRPVRIAAEGLPKGISLDPATGIVRGETGPAAEYKIRLTAENKHGRAEKTIRLVIGQGLAKTPPMGWNNWNCWGRAIDDGKVRAAADAMVASGLAEHGWIYINVDDCWQGERDPKTKIIAPNSNFPDMKALADYVHAQGLRFGVYTDAGPKTCAGYEASKGFEEIDARTYAQWGVDYVKVDWCNTDGMDPAQAYSIMGSALKGCGRDIVFSICNWGFKDPWTWGAKAGGNLWRTTGDIADNWRCVVRYASAQAPIAEWAGPGGWNDPDMLVVGKMGWGPPLRDSKLTPNEQYSHVSWWCLLSAPLLLGCDLTQLDDFTLNLLTNDEVLAVNQDVLGRQARRVVQTPEIEVWAKDMSDGSKAVGVFSVGDYDLGLDQNIEYRLEWKALGISGAWKARDLWRQKDMGEFIGGMGVSLPEHGVILMSLTPKR